MNIRTLISLLASVALVGIICLSAVAQNRASVRGQVSDEFGASIVGATVTVTDANGAARTATTGPDGTYTINGLAPGKYKVHAASAGFATSEDAEVDVAANRREPVNITLKIAAIESQVKVNADTPVSTEAKCPLMISWTGPAWTVTPSPKVPSSAVTRPAVRCQGCDQSARLNSG